MQSFDQNTLQFQYIQELLYSTHVPTVPVFRDVPNIADVEDKQVIVTKNAVLKRVGDEFQTIRAYHFGDRLENISQNFINKQNYYNTAIHEALGRYLRFYKDYNHIDLMPMYNCFSNRFIEDFSLPISLNEGVQSGSPRDASKKLFAIPVVPGKTYQIAVESSGISLQAQLGYYDGNSLVKISNKVTSLSSWLIQTSFNAPQLITIGDTNIDSNQKKYLHLFIELPYENDSSIVVLERYSDYDFCLYPYLIKENLFYQYAFSDKLFEYLVGNVIIPGYEFQESIADIQKILSSAGKLKDYDLGHFDESTHRCIYNMYRDTKLYYPGKQNPEPIRDFTGYVDSDIESLILQLRKPTQSKSVSTVGY